METILRPLLRTGSVKILMETLSESSESFKDGERVEVYYTKDQKP